MPHRVGSVLVANIFRNRRGSRGRELGGLKWPEKVGQPMKWGLPNSAGQDKCPGVSGQTGTSRRRFCNPRGEAHPKVGRGHLASGASAPGRGLVQRTIWCGSIRRRCRIRAQCYQWAWVQRWGNIDKDYNTTSTVYKTPPFHLSAVIIQS